MDTEIDKMLANLRNAADARTIKVLTYRQKGLSFGEIAKIMGVSRQRVKQIADRGLKAV